MVADRRLTVVLVAVNVAVALGLTLVTWGATGGDWATYTGLARGILAGEYTYWTELGLVIPDTFRTPGYPLLVAVVLKLFGYWEALKWLQFALYFATIACTAGVIRNLGGGVRACNLFLLLLLPSLNLPYYIGLMLPEVPTAAAVAASVYLLTLPARRPWHYVAIGVLYGVAFQLRPAFLFLPPLLFIVAAVRARRIQVLEVVTLVCFALTLLPYGVWNLTHHGVFRVTPLEGGAGVFHTGYWAGRLPGYTERRYWGNVMGDEVVAFVPRARHDDEIRAFNAEWDAIDAELFPLLTPQDALMQAARQRNPALFPTWNSRYTLERERLLKQRTWDNIRREPGYYLTYKAYSAVRLWVIGVMRTDFIQAPDVWRRLAVLGPTLITSAHLLLAVVLVPLAFRRRVIDAPLFLMVIVMLTYWTAVHVPFVIQARYTVPMRFQLLALVAVAADGLMRARTRAVPS